MAKFSEFLKGIGPGDLVTKTPEELAGEQSLSDFKAHQRQELKGLKSDLKEAEITEKVNRLVHIEEVLIKQPRELLIDLMDYLKQQQRIENSFQRMKKLKNKDSQGKYDKQKKIWGKRKNVLENTYHINELLGEVLEENKKQNPAIQKNRALASLIYRERLSALNNDERDIIRDTIAHILNEARLNKLEEEDKVKEKDKMRLIIQYVHAVQDDRPKICESVIIDYMDLLKSEFLTDPDTDGDPADEESLRRRAEEELERKAIIVRQIMLQKEHLKNSEDLDTPEVKVA